MPSPYTQDTRIGELITPLGKDKLVLARLDAVEGLSELFEYRIEAICVDKQILDFNAALGKHCSVSIKAIGGGKRWFDGILTETQCLGMRDGGLVYRLVLRPWLWVLSQRKNSLIFHTKTAPDIIAEIFSKYGSLADHGKVLSKGHPQLEYCVQYRESDLAFVCRLMEQHGISYHFQHREGGHKLVMGDSKSAYPDIPNETRPYYPVSGQYSRDEEHFFHWIPERRLTTGKVTGKDYNFQTSTTDLTAFKEGEATHDHSRLEVYDYPGKYPDKGKGEHYVQARLDAERAADERVLATGDCVTCFPGSLMTLTNFPDEAFNKEYLALRCTHSVVSEAYGSGSLADISEAYHGTYEFMLSSKPYAPPMVTEKPFVQGPQTAVVITKKAGEEIECDEHGRIRVRFHWDRHKDNSMWARVAQVWAGQGWGGMFIPRVGMEVIVEFLEGDPDQPIVTGCVYNNVNTPPFTPLPDKARIAGWVTNSTKGGKGSNHFWSDDKKGEELVSMQAERDMKVLVKKDSTTNINENEVHNTKMNRTTVITQVDDLTVNDEMKITVKNKLTIKVGRNSMIEMTGEKITISSTTVEVKADASLTTKSKALAFHESGGVMTIKGSLVKIN